MGVLHVGAKYSVGLGCVVTGRHQVRKSLVEGVWERVHLPEGHTKTN